VLPVPETDHVYWDWTLGEAVPERIKWFWARAKENPDRDQELAGAALPTAKSAPPDERDPDDIPF
jgi:hypothetical protein